MITPVRSALFLQHVMYFLFRQLRLRDSEDNMQLAVQSTSSKFVAVFLYKYIIYILCVCLCGCLFVIVLLSYCFDVSFFFPSFSSPRLSESSSGSINATDSHEVERHSLIYYA